MSGFAIRVAQSGDEDAILSLLRELAEYEKLTARFRLTREIVARDLIGPQRACCCDIGVVDSAAIAVMTWYRTYSTFGAARGLYLEDLYLRTQWRGKGYGRALLARLAGHAVRENADHIAWSVLDWNQPSIAFYESLHARRIEGWDIYRLAGDALENLAKT